VSKVKLRKSTLRTYSTWEIPTKEEVTTLIDNLGLTSGEVANLVGVKFDRTVRRWKSGESEITYAAWAILCEEAGYGCIWKTDTRT